MLLNKHARKDHSLSNKEKRITLPFIEKYKNQISHIPKEGIKSIIPEYTSLNQSKVASSKKV